MKDTTKILYIHSLLDVFYEQDCTGPRNDSFFTDPRNYEKIVRRYNTMNKLLMQIKKILEEE